MPNYQISLSEEIYRSLLTVAESSGVSPADWIAAQLPPNSFTSQSIIDSVTDLIGTINSQAEPHQSIVNAEIS